MAFSYIEEKIDFEQRLLGKINSPVATIESTEMLSIRSESCLNSNGHSNTKQWHSGSIGYEKSYEPRKKNRSNGERVESNHIHHRLYDYPRDAHPLIRELNHINPKIINMNLTNCRFFLLKSYKNINIFWSIKYSTCKSTKKGNRHLQAVYAEKLEENGGPIYLFFTGHNRFFGIAEMVSQVSKSIEAKVWDEEKNKAKGAFYIRWHYIKDVPHDMLKHILLGNKKNSPVTDPTKNTKEVPYEGGVEMVNIIHGCTSKSSILSGVRYFEKMEIERVANKSESQRESRSELIQSCNVIQGSDQINVALVSFSFIHFLSLFLSHYMLEYCSDQL